MSSTDSAPDQRLQKGAPATLRAVLVDQDGETDQSIDSGVTVTVTRLDGTTLVSAQSATCTDGVATYALTAAQTGAGLDVLTAEWTHNSVVRATTVHEVVGRHWFSLTDLRSVHGVDRALGQGFEEQTTQALIDARNWIETLIERATGVAWVPRTALHAVTGVGNTFLLRPRIRTIRSITIDDVAQTVADWYGDDVGLLRRVDGARFGTSNVGGMSVRIDHGYDAPPRPLVEAALIAAADNVKDRISTLGRRLTGQSGESGTISYARIDEEHLTGIPHVDAIINAPTYNHRIPGMA